MFMRSLQTFMSAVREFAATQPWAGQGAMVRFMLLTMMDFVLNMTDLTVEMMDFVLKMMEFYRTGAVQGEELLGQRRRISRN